jgi:hypothetical protein
MWIHGLSVNGDQVQRVSLGDLYALSGQQADRHDRST